jgi:drug/metabolite transporter (DMT)-like permease
MAKRWSNWGFVIALVLAAACWGFGAVISKYALEQIPPMFRITGKQRRHALEI